MERGWLITIVLMVWGQIGCSNEFVELNPDATEDDAGNDDGVDGEVVCTPDESPAVLEGPTTPDLNRASMLPCWDACESACEVLIGCDVYWNSESSRARCTYACRETMGCDGITADALCPNVDRLITVREMNECLGAVRQESCWCSSPEECWVTDDWLPESCSPESLCDGDRDPC